MISQLPTTILIAQKNEVQPRTFLQDNYRNYYAWQNIASWRYRLAAH